MNKKGQVLVIFLLLIPILIMFIALLVDLGLLMTRVYHVKDSIKEAITYGLKNDDIESVDSILKKNIDDEYKITSNNNIEIEVNGVYNSVFQKIFKKDSYRYHFKYLGYLDGDKIIIKEE